MKSIILSVIIITILSCGSTNLRYGNYDPYKKENQNGFFVNVLSSEPNKVKLITESPTNYYAWKSMNSNKPLAFINETGTEDTLLIPTVATITNDSMSRMNIEQRAYLANNDNLLINYLFFIDEYRCMYLSQDDKRSNKDFSFINLYYDNDQYKLEGDDKKIYAQCLQGYYHIKGDELFIDFDRDTPLYLRATINKDVISGLHISKPLKGESINVSHAQAQYSAFDHILDCDFLPVFELCHPDDKFKFRQFELAMGFHLNSSKNRNELHGKILDILECNQIAYDPIKGEASFIVKSIKHVLDGENSPFDYKRIYELDYNGFVFTVDEPLFRKTWDDDYTNAISTW